MKRLLSSNVWVYLLSLLFLVSCIREYSREESGVLPRPYSPLTSTGIEAPFLYHRVEKDISIGAYFSWMNAVVEKYDSLLPYQLTEQLIVHANPWMIDTFAHSDYYYQMERGVFVYDQRAHVVLHKGDSLAIPALYTASQLNEKLSQIHIDVNLPEYKLRIWQGDNLLHTFTIRIGQNRSKYLATEKRAVDLRTVIGSGYVYQIIYQPKYVNFTTGKEYERTRRDDQRVTLMPLIPTLETEINGVCYGQLIHPTTNPITLGRAYSHGCIGTREGDAWRIYFHSRKGTPVDIRYDLLITDEQGETIVLPDVYQMERPFM